MGKRCGRRAKEWKNRIKVVENGRKVVENAKRLVFYDFPLIVACWISIRVRSGSSPATGTLVDGILGFCLNWCFWVILVFCRILCIFAFGAILAYFGIFPHAGSRACR